MRTFTHDCGCVVRLLDVGWFRGRSRLSARKSLVGCVGANLATRLAPNVVSYRYQRVTAVRTRSDHNTIAAISPPASFSRT
jgi:hypothetical protein